MSGVDYFTRQLDVFELGQRVAMDLFAENHLDPRCIGRFCRYLQRILDIAHDRAWLARAS